MRNGGVELDELTWRATLEAEADWRDRGRGGQWGHDRW